MPLTTDRTGGSIPGSVLHTDRGPLTVVSLRRATRTGGSCTSRGSPTATRPRTWRGILLRAEPLDDARTTTSLGARAGRRPMVASPTAPTVGTVDRRRGQPGQRPAGARRRRPRARRVRHRPARPGRSPSTRPTACSTSSGTLPDADAHRRLHDLPGHGVGASPAAEPARQGPGAGLLDVRVHDLPRPGHRPAPHGGRRAVRRRAGMVLMAEPLFARGRGGRPAPPAAPTSSPGGPRASTRRRRASWPPGRLQPAVRALRGRRRAGARAPRRRRAVDRRLRARRRRGGGDGGARGGRRGCAGRDGQRRPRPARSSFSDGLLEYPHYTRPAELRGWTVPEVLAVGRPRPVAALAARPRRWPARGTRRPGLLERPRRSHGTTDRRLLAEF